MAETGGMIKEFREEGKIYFSQCRDEIAKSNRRLLGRLAFILPVLHAAYFVVAGILFRSPHLNAIYAAFLLIDILLAAAAFWACKRKASYAVVQTICMLLVCAVMAFILTISVFPFPDHPAIFFPIFYPVLSLVFIFPYKQINLVMTAFEVAFLVLAYRIKTPESISYDVFGSVTAWILGMLVSFLVLYLRLRENRIRMRLQVYSSTDETTGLPNRRSFNLFVEKEYTRCIENQMPVAIILMDIDDFKSYNDTYGHVAGDECLAGVGATIRAYAQRENIFIARYGGEEFAAVVSGDNALRAEEYAQNLLKNISCRSGKIAGIRNGYITISLGVAFTDTPQELSYTDLINQSDMALYQAKREGKNRVVRYDMKTV